MKTTEISVGSDHWRRVTLGLELPAGKAQRKFGTILSLASALRSRLGKDKIEPGDGPIAVMKSGAKLYWSDSRGVAVLSGHAWDGRDVDCYVA